VRELKFRAWDKKLNKFIGSFELEFLTEFTANILIQEKENIELMQYTGLKDRNGQEIYEGDIVKAVFQSGECGSGYIHREWHVEKVRYLNHRAGFYPMSEREFCREKEGSNTSLFVEVIGNIYEHPHLLDPA